MRVFRVAVSLWWDGDWWGNRRRSYRRRRYWLAVVRPVSVKGSVLGVQVGPVRMQVQVEGKDG